MTREKAKKHIEINLIALYDIGENIIECDDVMVIIDEIYNDHETAIEILMKANEEEISRHFNECEKYEAQLKAKESDLERQDMIIKCLNIDLDNKEKQLKAKDELIKDLECRAYHAEGYINDLHNNSKEQQ